DPETCIIREVREELGYDISKPKLIHTFYTSPGGCTERMFLYYSEGCRKDKKFSAGGRGKEKEDIQQVRLPGSGIREELRFNEVLFERIINQKNLSFGKVLQFFS